MKHLSQSIVIKAPRRAVYNQLTEFDAYARILQRNCMVRQLDECRVAWRARIWGRWVKWRTDMYEKVPDCSIAWCNTHKGSHHGSVTFDQIDGNTTRVTITLSYHPHELLARISTRLGAVEWHVRLLLRSFKRFIEGQSKIAPGTRARIRDWILHPGRSFSVSHKHA
jgi:uncharacterized membrane protein